MVIKSKGCKKSKSVVSGRRKKKEIKYNRKNNYKKCKGQNKIECCVCMETINDISDNIVMCGKVKHPLCGECKLKCKECPMCRSHTVNLPISQEFKMKIFSRSSKIPNEYSGKYLKIESSSSFLNGVYKEIRRDEWNSPVFKCIYPEILTSKVYDIYLLRESRFNKYYNDCEWLFRASSEKTYDKCWSFRKGKLIGNYEWNYRKNNEYYTRYMNIQRIS